MLFSSSLICLVGGGPTPAFSPRRLRLWNTQTDKMICEFKFNTAVIEVLMNKKRMIVVLMDKAYIYDLENLSNLQTLELNSSDSSKDMFPDVRDHIDPQIACAITASHQPCCYLALPASSFNGDVLVYDPMKLSAVKVVPAHKERLQKLAFTEPAPSHGALLATASRKGTLIRIFAIPSGDKIHAFRRGSYSATIFSISFDYRNSLMVILYFIFY